MRNVSRSVRVSSEREREGVGTGVEYSVKR